MDISFYRMWVKTGGLHGNEDGGKMLCTPLSPEGEFIPAGMLRPWNMGSEATAAAAAAAFPGPRLALVPHMILTHPQQPTCVSETV